MSCLFSFSGFLPSQTLIVQSVFFLLLQSVFSFNCFSHLSFIHVVFGLIPVSNLHERHNSVSLFSCSFSRFSHLSPSHVLFFISSRSLAFSNPMIRWGFLWNDLFSFPVMRNVSIVNFSSSPLLYLPAVSNSSSPFHSSSYPNLSLLHYIFPPLSCPIQLSVLPCHLAPPCGVEVRTHSYESEVPRRLRG